MDWQEQLISIYLYVCKEYKQHLHADCLRMSNYSDLSFSDEEVITLYMFGVIEKHTEIKTMYRYADRHLREWFPNLPSYTAFIQRINHLGEVFILLLDSMQSQQEKVNNSSSLLIDSFPVCLAKQGHRFKAKVAPQLANHGYCATKKLYFYGVRVHMISRYNKGTLPSPEYIGLTDAAANDGKIFEQIRPYIKDEEIFGDKAYKLPDAKEFEEKQNLTVLTPVKKAKGQKRLDSADKFFSTAVSVVRQPIETLFGWIKEKTGIEAANKVRSYNGLLVHVFGRIAAAMFFWNFLRI